MNLHDRRASRLLILYSVASPPLLRGVANGIARCVTMKNGQGFEPYVARSWLKGRGEVAATATFTAIKIVICDSLNNINGTKYETLRMLAAYTSFPNCIRFNSWDNRTNPRSFLYLSIHSF